MTVDVRKEIERVMREAGITHNIYGDRVDGGDPTPRPDSPAAAKKASKDERRIAQCAKLPDLQYQQQRPAVAAELRIGVGALDKLVKAHRARTHDGERDFLPHWNVEPWPEEVDGDALLDDLRNHFRRYVVLPEEADVALALWVLHTWVFDCFDITPYLAITSPTRRCGKTKLMTALHWLCCRSKKNDAISKAAIYRSVEADRPTLILDEVGWVVDLKDERQGILCGGFERLGHVEICEGEGANITTKRYATFCPKAFGLIGKLTPTLMDRSIEIPMKRKFREKVERLGRRDNDEHDRAAPEMPALGREQCRRAQGGAGNGGRRPERSRRRFLGATTDHRQAGRRRMARARPVCSQGPVRRRRRRRH